MTESNDIVVIGAGIIGLTTALTLTEHGHTVSVIADTIPGSTSQAAGASWGPYHAAPHDLVREWSATTLQRLTSLAGQDQTGVRLVAGIEASRTATTLPDWTSLLPDLMPCQPHELPKGFRTGWRYTVPVVDMPTHLSYLLQRLKEAGVPVVHQHVQDLTEATGLAPVVVDCTGMGARTLAGDDSLYPIQGQLVVVENPGIDEFFSEDTGDSPHLTHYLPQGNTVVLGGVALPNQQQLTPDPTAATAIIERCAAIKPQLRTAKILEHRVGARPTRAAVRVETQTIGTTQVIHNYGHGGAGLSLSWGCAEHALGLLKR